MRRKSRVITLGNLKIGGGAPVSVQSMTNTDTRDVKATLNQIRKLEDAGCELIRVAVPDMDAAEKIGEIKKGIKIPLIADIHFDYRLALRAIKEGVDGLRINPGNIGDKWKVKEVVNSAKDKGLPIRIGVNAGSLDKDLWEKYGGPTADPVEEIKVGFEILKALRIRQTNPEVISCPTCGRCEIDLESIALKVEDT